MTNEQLKKKRDEGIRWAIKKLFREYCDGKIGGSWAGRRAICGGLMDFNPIGWEPDPDKVCELLWDYRPFTDALDEYCRQALDEHTEVSKRDVMESIKAQIERQEDPTIQDI